MGGTLDSSSGWVALDADPGASIASDIVGVLEYESNDNIEVK